MATSTIDRPDDNDNKEEKSAEEFTSWVKQKSKEYKVSEDYFISEFFLD